MDGRSFWLNAAIELQNSGNHIADGGRGSRADSGSGVVSRQTHQERAKERPAKHARIEEGSDAPAAGVTSRVEFGTNTSPTCS